MDRFEVSPKPAKHSPSAVERIRRIRGVSWRWRDDVPLPELADRRGRAAAGVIAQEVQVEFPELVAEDKSGYLKVDYGGLATVLAEAVAQLRERIDALASSPSAGGGDHPDQRLKQELGPLADAVARLEQAALADSEYQALVGSMIESVKELDGRLQALEREDP